MQIPGKICSKIWVKLTRGILFAGDLKNEVPFVTRNFWKCKPEFFLNGKYSQRTGLGVLHEPFLLQMNNYMKDHIFELWRKIRGHD